MASLSDSFTKFVTKINEVSRKTDRSSSPEHDDSRPEHPKRPGSPFIMLSTQEEEDEGFKIQPNESESTNEANDNHETDGSTTPENTLPTREVHKRDPTADPIISECEVVGIDNLDEGFDSSDNDEAAMLENDELRSHRSTPLDKNKFYTMFDQCGRLVQVHELRKSIFKGGIEDSIRKDVWTFLFELYPFNSTTREREVLRVEKRVQYEAMKVRWKKILKTLVNDYEGVRYCPKWFSGCPENLKSRDDSKSVAGVKKVLEEERFDNKETIVSEDQPQNNSDAKVDNKDNFEQHLGTHSNFIKNTDITENGNNIETTKDFHPAVQISTEGTTNEPECEEIEDRGNKLRDISIALADAMQECDSNILQSTRLDVSANSVIIIEKEPTGIDSSEYLCPDISPNSDDHGKLHFDDEDLVDDMDSFINKNFPNPFTLPPEYINTQESLYSESENFQSVDISAIKAKQAEEVIIQKQSKQEQQERGNRERTFPLPSFENGGSEELWDANRNLRGSDSSVMSENNTIQGSDSLENDKLSKDHKESINDSVFQDSDHMSETIKAKEILNKNDIFEDATPGNFQSSQEDTQTEHYICKEKTNSSNNIEKIDLGNGGTSMSLPCPDLNKDTSFNTLKDTKTDLSECINDYDSGNRTPELTSPRILRSISIPPPPTSPASLERLSPHVAQMIRASTPKSNRKSKDQNAFELEIEEYYKQKEKELCEQQKTQNEEERKLNEQLLGIVQNANRYIEENLKTIFPFNQNHRGGGGHFPKSCATSMPLYHSDKSYPQQENQTTPCSEQSPNTINTIWEKEVVSSNSKRMQQNDSLFMLPLESAEADIFLYDRPSLKLVSENHEGEHFDNVDSSPRSFLCPYCSFQSDVSAKLVLTDSLGEDQIKFMEIQAQVFAARQPYDSKNILESIRVIDKDVPRTDREMELFSGDNSPALLKLRDALLTFAFFHPDVGYAQGMNDIMARFLFVMDSEVEAYWMFAKYMEHFKNDFVEAGMLKKISLVEQLLMKMDRELYDFLQSTDMGLIFCHRWLLLNFKREFDYIEAIRLFEITSSRHLEVSSLEAEIERSKERAKEFVRDSAGSHMEEVFLSPEYPFDIFVCVAMLMECRNMIMGTNDSSTVYQILSNLPKTFELQNILRRSEELFYRYCRKTTVDCFQIIDDLEVKDFNKKKKNTFSLPFNLNLSYGNSDLGKS